LQTYNLFRRQNEEDLYCAVPVDVAVPSFVTDERWEWAQSLDVSSQTSTLRRLKSRPTRTAFIFSILPTHRRFREGRPCRCGNDRGRRLKAGQGPSAIAPLGASAGDLDVWHAAAQYEAAGRPPLIPPNAIRAPEQPEPRAHAQEHLGPADSVATTKGFGSQVSRCVFSPCTFMQGREPAATF